MSSTPKSNICSFTYVFTLHLVTSTRGQLQPKCPNCSCTGRRGLAPRACGGATPGARETKISPHSLPRMSSSRRDLAIRPFSEAHGGFRRLAPTKMPQLFLYRSAWSRALFARRRDTGCARNEDFGTSFATDALFSSRSRDPSRRGGAQRLLGKDCQI